MHGQSEPEFIPYSEWIPCHGAVEAGARLKSAMADGIDRRVDHWQGLSPEATSNRGGDVRELRYGNLSCFCVVLQFGKEQRCC